MKRAQANHGYSLLEVLVASSIILVVFGTLITMTDQTQRLMKGTSSKVEQFQEARLAFEALTRRISEATLNTYWDYQYQTGSQTIGGKTVQVRMPARYERGSELRFRTGPMAELNREQGQPFQPGHGIFFQAPSGQVDDSEQRGAMDHLLNTWGYFVELNSDEKSLPGWMKDKVPARERFRLMELMEPAEELSVYQFQHPRAVEWFTEPLRKKNRPARALADNVVALIVLPRLARPDEEAQRAKGASATLAPHFRYDSTQSSHDPVLNSKHQLPPVVQVVMIAIDEESAERLAREQKGKPRLGIEYGTFFTKPELLDDDPSTPQPGDGDIEQFTAVLRNKLRVSARVFSTHVNVRGAKWSRAQEF